MLLSEGVCQQLDIVRYHLEAEEVNGPRKGEPSACVQLDQSFVELDARVSLNSARTAGHFPCPQPSKAAVHTLWWKGLYKDVVALAKSRPQAVFGRGTYKASAETSFTANLLQPAFLGTKKSYCLDRAFRERSDVEQ